MRRATGFVSIVLSTLLLAACFSGIGSPDGKLSLVVDETVYEAGTSLDLGDVDLQYGAFTITAQLTSTSMRALIVTGIFVQSPFAVETPPIPFTVEPRQCIDVSISFDPNVMVDTSSPLEITLDGFTDSLTLVLAGTGVSDAANVMKLTIHSVDYESSAAFDAGMVDPAAPVAIPVSIVNMTDGPILLTGASGTAEEFMMHLAGTPLAIPVDSPATAHLILAPPDSGTHVAAIELALKNGTAPFVLNVSGEGNYAPAGDLIVSGMLVAGANLTANYTYSDAESDPAGPALYQWYRTVANDENGDYEPIADAVDVTCSLTMEEADRYVKVRVTPTATAGTSPGPTLESAPVGPIIAPE